MLILVYPQPEVVDIAYDNLDRMYHSLIKTSMNKTKLICKIVFVYIVLTCSVTEHDGIAEHVLQS